MTKNKFQQGMGLPIILGIISIIIVTAGVAFYAFQAQTNKATKEEQLKPVDQKLMEKDDEVTGSDRDIEKLMKKSEVTEDAMMKKDDKDLTTMTYDYSGQLNDVTAGNIIRGLNTAAQSSGVARANFKDGNYSLYATFNNLPEPQGTDFYEGWVVRKGLPLGVISTGRISQLNGVYSNTYQSGENLIDHDFYVLTIEPDDGDPAPADHILEGNLLK